MIHICVTANCDRSVWRVAAAVIFRTIKSSARVNDYLSLSSRENDRDGGVYCALNCKQQRTTGSRYYIHIKLYICIAPRGARGRLECSRTMESVVRFTTPPPLFYYYHISVTSYVPAIIYNNTTFSLAQRTVEKFIGLWRNGGGRACDKHLVNTHDAGNARVYCLQCSVPLQFRVDTYIVGIYNILRCTIFFFFLRKRWVQTYACL